MLKSELDMADKAIYERMTEEIPIDLAGDEVFRSFPNGCDEYKIEEGCANNSPRIILKASGIKEEFKGIFHSFGEEENYDNHDGMYHRKDSDHHDRHDEEDKDEKHEDEHNRDEDNKCYQRRSYYPSAAHANEGREEFA
ncbi:hypothetical protein C922_05493 [Plasmodium inui San Antonio 1]|uniref:Uncharacterized protein n=1 Tax=Plasmodium inui San Antonio 1 TaxID=1237626 RepID=W6ZT79_9APIC|nr:hypothetical protein C922_05493 [Plasmodium inui San Antonio 1]EUD64122.1 hypothetical protein C922_05493 [Plasmodium inui San Antonio 1]